MAEGIVWWLAAGAIGAIAFPVAFVFFRFLPDRGYAFSKVLGLLLMTYLLWAGATVRVIPNERWSIVLILVVMAAASAALAVRRWEDLKEFLRDRWWYVLTVEGVFTVAYVTSLWLRSYVAGADLTSGEKPMQYAFINAVLRADHFPAEDPWFAGHALSYYYFGFIKVGALIKLTGVPTQIAFNLALGLTIALAAAAVFGLVYNLVAVAGRQRHAVIFGLVGVALLLLAGNLGGLFELVAIHSDGPKWLYDWLAINGLDGSQTSSAWYPKEEQFWWVRGRHIPDTWAFAETPFWGFQLGDNTTQNLVMPYVLMTMGLAFNFLRSRDGFGLAWIRANPAAFLLAAVMVGSLSFFNSWSFPPGLLMVVLAAFAASWWSDGRSARRRLADAAVFSAALCFVAVVLFLPFYFDSREAMWPIVPSEVTSQPVPQLHIITQPKHLFITMGPLLWLAFGLVAATLSWAFLRRLGRGAAASLLSGLVPLAVWGVLVTRDLGLGGLLDEIQTRDANMLTIGILVALLCAATLGAWRFLAGERDGLSESAAFSLATVGVAFLLLLGLELFFVRDQWGGARITTMFKLFQHSWVLLSVGGAFSIYYVLFQLRPVAVPASAARYLWAGVGVVLVGAGMVFVPAVAFSRTNAFSNPQSLNSYRFSLEPNNPNQLESIRWLNKEVGGTPVMLEAEIGNPVPWSVSSFTGLPTVLGVSFHETGFRGSAERVRERQVDVEKAYTTLSVEEARAILEKYDVEYVYLGPFEEARYGLAGFGKFADFMDVAFQNSDVTIYKMREEGPQVRDGR